MSESTNVVEELMNAVNNFPDSEELARYQQAIEVFEDLERRGLLEKRGYSLLPIEESHKFPECYQNKEKFSLERRS